MAGGGKSDIRCDMPEENGNAGAEMLEEKLALEWWKRKKLKRRECRVRWAQGD